MCALFANLYVLLTWGSHMIYHGDPIYVFNMIGYGWFGRETEVRLDGWCDDGFGPQRIDGGGSASMPERSDRQESPGAFVTE